VCTAFDNRGQKAFWFTKLCRLWDWKSRPWDWKDAYLRCFLALGLFRMRIFREFRRRRLTKIDFTADVVSNTIHAPRFCRYLSYLRDAFFGKSWKIDLAAEGQTKILGRKLKKYDFWLPGQILLLFIVHPHPRDDFCCYLTYFRTLGITFVVIYHTSAPSGLLLLIFIVLPRGTVGFLPFEQFLFLFSMNWGHLSSKRC